MFIRIFLAMRPFLHVLFGFVSSFLLFNSLSFEEKSIVAGSHETNIVLAVISLANLLIGLVDFHRINNGQINFLKIFALVLITITLFLEIKDYLVDNSSKEF